MSAMQPSVLHDASTHTQGRIICICAVTSFATLPLCVARAAGADQWVGLCDALASRLAQTGMAHAASLCYICACNVDQVRVRGRMC